MTDPNDPSLEKQDQLQLLRFAQAILGVGPRSLLQTQNTQAAILSRLGPKADPKILWERTIQSLLTQATHSSNLRLGSEAHPRLRPFYQRPLLDRALLILLSSGRFSYERLSSLLGLETREIERRAWALRLELALDPENPRPAPYPRGGPRMSVSQLQSSCPEYDFEAPWTQRYLDGDSDRATSQYLQNHVMICDQCRKALYDARTVLQSAENLLPGFEVMEEELWLSPTSASRTPKPWTPLLRDFRVLAPTLVFLLLFSVILYRAFFA